MKCIGIFFVALVIFLCTRQTVFAQIPASANYKIANYGFGSGSTTNSTSTSYKLNGIAGEVENGQAKSTTYKIGGGLTYVQQAYVPAAPTVTNPATDYDRLKIVINTSANPTDTTYAMEISSDSNFATNVSYINTDYTLANTLTTSNFQTYSAWGGASGGYVTGLKNNTTYYVKVKARQGNFTETEFGPAGSALTSDPTLTFGIDSSSITFTALDASNSYTDAAKTSVLTTTTNAYNGYVIYGKVTGPLTAGTSTIANYSGSNDTPTTWSGTGFGYTTNDNNLVAGTGGASRFASGTKYAGFTSSTNGDPVADHESVIQNPTVSNEQFTISYKLAGNSTTPAGTYKTTIEYIVVPSY